VHIGCVRGYSEHLCVSLCLVVFHFSSNVWQLEQENRVPAVLSA